jgi:phage shock protein B
MLSIGLLELVIIGLIALILLWVVGFLMFAIVKVMGSPKQDSNKEEEEARLIQEIYQGFLRMEDRIETLETILVEREKGAHL